MTQCFTSLASGGPSPLLPTSSQSHKVCTETAHPHPPRRHSHAHAGEEDTDISQLAKIFQILGTPTEANWPGYTSLPDYPKYQIPSQPAPSLQRLLPSFRPDELDLLTAMVALNPAARPSTSEALDHVYFKTEPRATPMSELVLPLPPPST